MRDLFVALRVTLVLIVLTGNATGVAAVPNMEGKEVRFGTGGSVLAAAVTSGGATGSCNAVHDSITPVGALMPLVNLLLGELSFGGLGTLAERFTMVLRP